MHLVVAGSRNIIDPRVVADAIRESGWTPTFIIYGGAKGVDRSAAQYADANRIPKILFKADWEANGRSAGPIRNSEMVKYAKEEGRDGAALVAIWDGVSNGTFDCIKKAHAAGLPVFVKTIRIKGVNKHGIIPGSIVI